MKKYRILVGIIMALSIIIIGTSEPAKNLNKARGVIGINNSFYKLRINCF